MKRQKVYIIDDDDAVRDSIKALMDSVGLAAETFSSAKEFLDQYSQEMIGCIVSDVRMARMSGLMLQKQLNERGGNLPLIFITGHGDVQMAVQALKEGAFDFIQKPFQMDGLLDCINQALEENLRNDIRKHEQEQFMGRVKLLTKRECEVLDLLVDGKSSKQISRELHISPRTVDVHRQNILNKFELNSAAELISHLSNRSLKT